MKCSPLDTAPPRAAWARVWLMPLSLVAIGLTLHLSGIDVWFSDQFFDGSAHRFLRRHDVLLETWGHVRARTFVTLVWLCMLAGAFASLGSNRLRAYRSVLWSLTMAMVLGPLIVVALKNTTSYPCPWDLQRYGGSAPVPSSVFATPARAGHCFPSGHSAGGFSLLAFYFAALALRCRRLARIALLFAAVAGIGFSAVRVVQGAHFLSHAFWSAAVDWLAAGLVFHARGALVGDARGTETQGAPVSFVLTGDARGTEAGAPAHAIAPALRAGSRGSGRPGGPAPKGALRTPNGAYP